MFAAKVISSHPPTDQKPQKLEKVTTVWCGLARKRDFCRLFCINFGRVYLFVEQEPASHFPSFPAKTDNTSKKVSVSPLGQDAGGTELMLWFPHPTPKPQPNSQAFSGFEDFALQTAQLYLETQDTAQVHNATTAPKIGQ